MPSLHGRVAIVTGAGQGIGRTLAAGLAAAGASVAVLDRDGHAAADTVASLTAAGHRAIALTADISQPEQVDAAFDEVADRLGGIDALVNNAGVRFIAPLMQSSLSDWQRTLDVNLTGTFICVRAALRHMLAKGSGSIVNIGSMAGTLALHERAAYSVTKAGIAMLTKCVAMEVGGSGVRCNAVAPGVIETPLTAHYFEDPQFGQRMRERTPSGRWGTPEDLVGPVLFLCSDESAFVQGETLHVDGGWVAGKGY